MVELTQIDGIGPKTEQELRRRLRGSRPTSRAGEKVDSSTAARNQEVARFVLAADQQRALAAVESGFTPERSARETTRTQTSREASDLVRRGDYRVQRDTLQDARATFEDLPEETQQEDRGSREPVTTNVELWEDNIGVLDFPGIDTPSTRRPRSQGNDALLNDITGQTNPREAWQESEPEPDEAQRRLGEEPPTANADRSGVMRNEDGTFFSRPIEPDQSEGQYRSANGLYVGEEVQDPTIGRDPDDGEFVNRPLDNEPTVTVPDPFGFF